MNSLSGIPRRIHRILDEGARHGPDRPAITDENGRTWTYAELIQAVQTTAPRLKALGIGAGDKVLLVCENSIAAIVLLYALSALDAWAVLANARLGERELDQIHHDCQPGRTLYVHRVSTQADAHAERAQAALYEFSSIGPIKVSGANPQAQAEAVYEDPARQVAVVIYTTGSTGHPKGVMLSHQNLGYVASPQVRSNPHRPEDVVLCVLPMSHSYGLTLMQSLLCAGAHIHVRPRFSLKESTELIQAGVLTIFFAVPAMLSKMVHYASTAGISLSPNRLRYVYTGTAPLSLTLRNDVETLFDTVLQNGYGLTETSPTISRTRNRRGDGKTGIGFPIPGVEVRIEGDDGHQTIPATGELMVKGPNVMLGYYGKPKQSAAAMTDDGYLRTGDIVEQAPDGELFIIGRSKELIIHSGFNVYPAEIEAVLNAHPAVLVSAVIGRPTSDNEDIIAFIEPAQGAAISPEDALHFVASRLAHYKVPQRIVILNELPVAPNGKVRKSVLKEMAL
ncbi:class I adenylate-forming enzyme family protein [Castellaniella sp. FW104-16D08]|uniref:class I adenylate-forming enzyme family protein n=1 Tax=unclassified Castellaniella TaxID=2617606 RepID=UPI003314A4E0